MIKWKKILPVLAVAFLAVSGRAVLAGSLQTVILPVAKTVTVPSDKIKAMVKENTKESDGGGKPEHIDGTWMISPYGRRYQYVDGNYLFNTWADIDGKKYYFDGDGTMQTEWISDKGDWYYLGDDGAMRVGWVLDDEKYYYMNTDGAMMTGWVTDKKKRYYLSNDGVMVTGWNEIDGVRYYMDNSGAMKTGWVDTDEGRYYFDKDGKTSSGWLKLKDIYYYFNSEGIMQTGWIVSEGKVYYLNDSGELDNSARASINRGKTIALTFDDGPGPYTDRLLTALQNNGAKATFFMIGDQVSAYSSVLSRMSSIGCELGSHSFDHSYLTSMTAKEIKTQMSDTRKAIKTAAGSKPTVARVPYGSYNDTVLNNLGLPAIQWSIDTEDWKTLSVESTVVSVLSQIEDGDVVLMHDIHSTTVEAAEVLIAELREEGVNMVTVSELAQKNGVGLKNGNVYEAFH